MNKKKTFTITLLTGSNGQRSQREVKAWGMIWAVTDMNNDIRNNWHDKSVRVIAIREGKLFTDDEEAEISREKAIWRCR